MICCKTERKVISTKSWKITLNFLHFLCVCSVVIFGFQAPSLITSCFSYLRVMLLLVPYFFLSLNIFVFSFWLTLYLEENERYLSCFGISWPGSFFSASLEPFHYCMCVFSSGVSKIKCKNQLFDLVSKGKIKEMKFTIEQQDMKIIVLNFLARALTLLRHITKMPVFSIKVGREFFFLSGSTVVVFSP